VSAPGSGAWWARLRPGEVTCSRADLAAITLIALTMTLWVALAGTASPVRVFTVCEGVLATLYLVGSLVASARVLAQDLSFELPLRLLTGYVVVNTALLALAWLSPLGLLLDFALLAAVALALFASARARSLANGDRGTLAFVAFALLATSWWCQDSLRPMVVKGSHVVFGPWVDGFYHAVHLRIFGESHGPGTILDFRMSEVPARPYHYGIYLLPALIGKAAGIAPYTAFAAILAPFGVLLTGLAAQTFFASLWGRWAGACAAAALYLLPDGAHQGLSNTFMSYHWLTQISPSATYGLAVLALAWLFVIQGCRRGRSVLLLIGWTLAITLTVYKLHYVVASALLLLLIPAVFFRADGRPLRRLVAAGAAAAIYVVGLRLAAHIPGVPLIRFDGSGAKEILKLILSFADAGPLRDALVARTGPSSSLASNLVWGLPYVLASIFGLITIAFLGLWIGLRKRLDALLWLFPLVILANFLVMFFGLALDFASSTPDELSHRPLLIAFFFVVTWVGGVVGLLVGPQAENRRWVRVALLAPFVVLLVVPVVFGRGVQRLPAMPMLSPFHVPSALLEVATFIRTHGSEHDVIQDSQFDRVYALSALAERQSFVSHTLTRIPYRDDMVEARTHAIERLMALGNAKLVVATARALGFRWFVLQRGDVVAWPPELVEHPAFEAGPFKVFDL